MRKYTCWILIFVDKIILKFRVINCCVVYATTYNRMYFSKKNYTDTLDVATLQQPCVSLQRQLIGKSNPHVNAKLKLLLKYYILKKNHVIWKKMYVIMVTVWDIIECYI